MYFKKLGLIIISFLLAGSIFAQDGEQQIRQMLNERDNEIKELLGPEGTSYTQEQRNELKEIINGVIDFRSMARYALQDTWNELSDERRERFVDLFATVVRDQSLNRLEIYRAEIEYESIEVDGDSAKVSTVAQLENVRTPVGYEMVKKDGEWVVTDFSIDGVSTAESYNTQFQNIIRKRGFDALFDSLERRAARASST
ncbi:MlaC/ttg2D family ABC transporter substrate-binding protein [Rhodohalobacter sp. 8-1]|uniref:MlaC/ttg2D family ABC transporter substrate-binding protein n=1 Tax=Rhodohalobacter sp. 8-1 TaxID=3131972 RepID=UPI0030ED804A